MSEDTPDLSKVDGYGFTPYERKLQAEIKLLKSHIETLNSEKSELRIQSEMDAARADRNAADYSKIKAENKILREGLEKIKNDPHCRYEQPLILSDSNQQYNIGVVDGHRCASVKAAETLKKLERSEDERTTD